MLFLDKTIDLSTTEIEIYKYIQANIEKVAYMRIRDLSNATYTSTASILRFCRKFECNGYAEFRIKLQMYLKERKTHAIKSIDESAHIDFIQRTTQPSFHNKIIEAAKILTTKELVIFLGYGSSNIMASYGALYFSSMFNFSIRIEDPSDYPIHFLSESLSKKYVLLHYLSQEKLKKSLSI